MRLSGGEKVGAKQLNRKERNLCLRENRTKRKKKINKNKKNNRVRERVSERVR